MGYNVARTLVREGHDVALVEKESSVINKLEGLDALVIKGRGGSPKKLEEAYIGYTEVFVAVTGSDESNIIGCILAKEHGAKTIARLTRDDYINEPISYNLTHLGIDIAISPELISAVRIARMITMPMPYETESFAGGRIRVLEVLVKEDAFIANKSIRRAHLPSGTNVVAIHREGDIIIPSGRDRFMPGDRVVMIIGNLRIIPDIQDIFGKIDRGGEEEEKTVKKVVIYGATDLGIVLTKLLSMEKMDVIILDEDREKCNTIAEEMPSNVLILNGSATNRDVFIEEGLDNVDAFLALTPQEETNVFACLVAKQYGADKTVALIQNPERKPMIEDIGVDLAVNLKLNMVGTILSHVHREEIQSISVLYRGDALICEIKIPTEAKIIGKPIRKLRLPKGLIIGALVRGGRVKIPRGSDKLEAGDRAVIFLKTELMKKMESKFFKT